MSAVRTARWEAAGARRGWSAWQRFTWRRPEWWTLALSAGAWLLLLAGAARGSHGHHTGGVGGAALGSASPGGSHGVVHGALMIVAMMPPLVLSAVRATSRRSLWHRRDRAIGGFLVGYLAPWLLAGLAVGLGAATVAGALGPGDLAAEAVLAAVAFAVAAAWQLTTVKRRALWSCHRTVPLAPDGWRADRDCVRYGWMVGGRCLLSCWAMMLACVLAGGVPVMAGVFVLGASERYTARPRPLLFAGVPGVMALVYTVRALAGG